MHPTQHKAFAICLLIFSGTFLPITHCLAQDNPADSTYKTVVAGSQYATRQATANQSLKIGTSQMAGSSGSYIYPQPVFAAIIATVFLQEIFTAEMLIAGLMIFLGVFLVSRKDVPVVQE